MNNIAVIIFCIFFVCSKFVHAEKKKIRKYYVKNTVSSGYIILDTNKLVSEHLVYNPNISFTIHSKFGEIYALGNGRILYKIYNEIFKNYSLLVYYDSFIIEYDNISHSNKIKNDTVVRNELIGYIRQKDKYLFCVKASDKNGFFDDKKIFSIFCK